MNFQCMMLIWFALLFDIVNSKFSITTLYDEIDSTLTEQHRNNWPVTDIYCICISQNQGNISLSFHIMFQK